MAQDVPDAADDKGMPMPQKEWIANVHGHEVRVVNTWTGGTRLYIDGDCRDRNHGLFAPTWRRWLSARVVQGDPSSDLVEVHLVALLQVKARIFVNGSFVAGDAG
ncbi:hypothetical protein [Pseudoxanthomonas suwonensis]|uniref:Uncharacterized protein n=1 Tax=Pseudoxanthomonas suwonensis TaxID=314722 RepID=A0A0E3Z1B2_9GAMM|nr:hypothetical protein [Pseudoxanthomonas suwonensis]AKC86509.1 hypothetical protein WQ53_06750 [Pseudoxanthomonas suwonensis]